MLTTEGEMRLSLLRAKRAQGTELTMEEMHEVVAIITAGRRSAASVSEASKRKTAAVATRSAEELLKGLIPGV